MTRHILNGRYFETIEMDAVNDTWLIGSTAVIAAEDEWAIYLDDDITGNHIKVAGTVTGDGGSIISLAERTRLEIAASGVVIGAIDFGGRGSSIDNGGHIVSVNMGMAAEGGGIRLHNSGSIDAGKVGVFADALEKTFVNTRTGSIFGGEIAVKIYGDEGVDQRIVNQGRIKGVDFAIQAGSANDTVINTGRIIGDVDLGDGDDVFDTRHGMFKGRLEGGDGNDTLITDSAKVRLIETDAEGFDIVKSTVSYKLNKNVDYLQLIGKKDIDATGTGGADMLVGNVGNNVIRGGGGADAIDGGEGNDRLIGGAGGDTFGFATGYGRDEIVDFSAGDKIYVHNWKAIGNFQDIKDHASNHGADVWIAAGHDTLIIDNMHKADLHAGDFQF